MATIEEKLRTPLGRGKKTQKTTPEILLKHYLCILNLLYKTHGIKALIYTWLLNNSHKRLYNFIVGKCKMKIVDVAEYLGISNEWKEYLRKKPKYWCRERIDKTIKEIIKRFGYFPAAGFLREKGYGSFITAFYTNNMSVAMVEKKYNVTKDPKFWSRNGICFLSLAEACFANFLYARGIKFKKGERYPEEYSNQTGRKYGIFDIHFEGQNGSFKDNWVDVEIWGENPNGHDKKNYANKRNQKINFNKKNKNFLGIEYRNCYNEDKLINILKPYIGVIKPFVFEKETDHKIKSTMWSLADSVIERCKYIMNHNDNNMPGESWLRCRKGGKYEHRKREDWEKKYNLNSLCVHIKQVGGMRKIREILNCPQTSTLWNKEKILQEIKDIYITYGRTPGSIQADLYITINQTEKETELMKRSARIIAAANHHFNGKYREACEKAIPQASIHYGGDRRAAGLRTIEFDT